MLSKQEKDQLYLIIASAIGEDSTIKSWKNSFNGQTVEVAKRMIKANEDCNAAMKALVLNLMHVSKLSPSQWIKRAFSILRGATKKTKFNGLACKNVTKYKWKTALQASVI